MRRSRIIPSSSADDLTDEDRALLNAWKDEGILYVAPATYTMITRRRPRATASGARWVHDAMRDHWHDLLPVIAFNRWKHAQMAAFQLLTPTGGPPIGVPPCTCGAGGGGGHGGGRLGSATRGMPLDCSTETEQDDGTEGLGTKWARGSQTERYDCS